MKRLNLQHWSFKKRLYVVAIAAGICTLISVAANFFIIRDYDSNVEHIAQGELNRLNQIAYSFRELSDSHSELINLLRLVGKNQPEQKVYLLGSKLIDRMDRLHTFLRTQADKTSLDKYGRPYKSPFHPIARELKNYRNAASVSIEMLTVNPSLSEKYMIKATSSFNKVNQLLSVTISEVSEHIDHELQEELELINRIYWPISILVLIVAGLIAPLIFKIIRDLTTNFRWIGTTLENLRLGNTAINIPERSAEGEMQNICGSLNQFRNTLINLRDSEAALSDKNRLLIEESQRRQLTEKELRRSLSELSKAIDAAKASNKAKSLFMANISHEIRTPLNAVLGMAQLLQSTSLDKLQKDYIETLYKQGQHLLQLLNSVLDFSRMESGKLILKYQPFLLDKLLDEITSLFKTDQQKHDILLKIDIAPDVENQLFGDPLRIRQILINLLSNAYKFTRQGEIRIHIQNSPAKPECVSVRPGQCPNTKAVNECHWHSLLITISDTGIGIAKEKQQYIFDNFTQVDESFTREYGGTGIGLAICKQLVELMDGEIGVESEPGQGATFWCRICLPSMGCIEQEDPA